MAADVTVLIPTRFDSRPQLDLCLRTVRKYTRIPYRLIVGDSGADPATREFLAAQEDVAVVDCPEPLRAKDTLARAAQTPFFLFLHDDTQILREGWLARRLAMMEADPDLGVLGVIAPCFVSGLRRYVRLSPLDRRFLPLAMMVRRAMQEELDLLWGLYKPFDTGSIAYLQYRKQKRWRFRTVRFKREVRHWGQMAWFLKKTVDERDPRADALIAAREAKTRRIREILETGAY